MEDNGVSKNGQSKFRMDGRMMRALELLWIQDIVWNDAEYEAVQLVVIQAICLMDIAVYEEVRARRKSGERGAWTCVVDGTEVVRGLELSEQLIHGITAYHGLQNNGVRK